MRRRPIGAVLALALPVLLAACGGADSSTPAPSPPPSTSAAGTPSGDPSPSASASATPTASPSGSTGAPAQGTPTDPVALEPSTDLLDWTPLPGRVIDTVTTDGTWTLTLDQSQRTAVLTDGEARIRLASGQGRSFGDALLDDAYAVVVAQDDAEGAPAIATVVDLADGSRWRLDGRSAVPTTSGGSWTLAGARLLHPTLKDGAYCLAEVDLAARSSTVGYCAPPRSGFNSALLSTAGLGLLTFDDSQPSCRTAVTLDGATATPLPGVPDCSAWQGLPTPEGAVWSTIPKPRRVEHAQYFARSGESWFDLGPGVSGTLTWCGGSAFFSRDPDDAADPARLLRWDGARLTVAYEAPAGQSFIAEPRCAGSRLNISVLAEGGDEQVSATVD
ncbi:hypothetical protein GCM10022215_25990 [Nocardioides fonticola]|uniref:Uncharacterized protein n=1 Tax=Nocardioides fonticola TaxID=450363 RepID=A0ABP7XLU8_9ACTN